MFKKAFWVPYEDSTNYPTLAKTMEAISKYCEENGESYTFINDDEVEINGKRYEIYRGFHSENDSPLHPLLLSRCRAGCRGKSLISGLFSPITTKTTEK